MEDRLKFYATMVAVIACLLGNALVRSARVEVRREQAQTDQYETLTYHECAEQYGVLLKTLSRRPADWQEYFATMHRVDMLEGSARKAMKGRVFMIADPNRREEEVTREIPVSLRAWFNEYQRYINSWPQGAEWKRAYDDYVAAGFSPLLHPSAPISGAERLLFWWGVFHFGAMPLIVIHYGIQIRRKGMRVWLEVCSNPAFPFWLFLWEVGLFRYPVKTSPAAQLRRARRWAMLVLSSSLSCFAGTGKTCEKREQAPQHQPYKGKGVTWTFATTTMSNYPGLDGGLFFPGVDQWTTVTAKFACGVYASFFDAEPITRRGLRPNFGREMDLILGWSGHVAGYSFDLNTTYLNAFPISEVPRGDVMQFSEKVSRKLSFGKRTEVGPYVWLRQAVPVRGPTPVGGWFVHWGGTLSRKFGKGDSGSVSMEQLHDSGAFGFKPGYIGRVFGNLTWKRGKRVSVQLPIVIVSAPLSHTGDGRKPLISFGIGFSFGQ